MTPHDHGKDHGLGQHPKTPAEIALRDIAASDNRLFIPDHLLDKRSDALELIIEPG